MTDTTTTTTTNLLNRIFLVALKIFVMVGIIFYIPGTLAYKPQEMFIQYSAIILFGMSWFVPKRREVGNFFIGLFMIYAALHTIFFKTNDFSSSVVLNIFFFLTLLKVISERIDLNFGLWGRVFALMGVLNVSWLILQYYNIDPVFSPVDLKNTQVVDMVGFMNIRFALGALAALTLPFMFANGILTCLIAIPMLYFSKSCTTLLAAVLSFMFLLWHKNRKAFWWTILFAGAFLVWYIFFFDLPSGQFSKRLMVWSTGVRILAGSTPWFGKGFGSWAASHFVGIQNNGQPEYWMWAHNDFLQLAFEGGIAALVILYGYFKGLYGRLNLKEKGSQIIAGLWISLGVTAFFHFPLHIGRLVVIVLIIMAFTEAYLTEKKESYEKIT